MNAASAPSVPASSPVLPPADFSDWLSPILVKELRQGLKTRTFVAIFILVQVVMTLLVGMQMLALSNGGSRDTMMAFDGFFWAFVWIPLLVLMPARGLMVVSEEIKANTLDLVQLTRMSAFRIVFGKWVALVAQSVLLVAAILPYAVLRYFFGQVNVVDDVVNILTMLGTSLILTAGAVALSSAPLVFRLIALVVGLPLVMAVGAGAMFASRVGGSGFIGTVDQTWISVSMVVLYVYLLLEIAATRIAPLSENHAARKRVVALGMAVVWLLLTIVGEQSTAEAWGSGCILIWIWIVLEALCEQTVKVPSLYSSFAKRGIMARLAGRFLYPGWASGIVFTTLLAGMIAVSAASMMGWDSGSDLEEALTTIVLLFAAILTPLPVLLLFPQIKQPIWLYVLVQALCGLLFAIASIVGSTPGITQEAAYAWLSPIPTSAFMVAMAEGPGDISMQTFWLVSVPVCCLLGIYLLFRVAREFRLISKLEKESLAKN
jgi:hypothetical protein